MRRPSIAAIGAAALVAVAVTQAEEPAVSRYRSVEIAPGHFRCEVPEGWYFDRDEREEARIHYHGFFLHGPKGGEDIGPRLSVRYFAPDNTLFRGSQGYLDRQLGPGIIKLAREKTSEARDVIVAGRPAKTFTRDTFEYFPPESVDAKEIPVREEHFVVPHLGGFVIVRFEAPTAAYAEPRKALAHLLETLRLMPETTFQTLHFAASGLAPEEAEARVTMPIEAALGNMPSLETTWSASFCGESVIVLAMPAAADSAAFRREIRRRLSPLRAGLPPRTHITFDPVLPGGEPVLTVSLSASETSEDRPAAIARLSALADRHLRGRIAAVSGVAEASLIGSSPRYEIVPSAERLAKHSVDIRDLVAAVRNEPTPAGPAATDTSPDDLVRRTVAVRDGRSVSISDVADVRLATFEPRGGEGSGEKIAADALSRTVRLRIRNTPDSDCGTVYRAVERVLDEIRPTLSEGVRLEHRLTESTANPCREALGVAPGQFLVEVAGSDLTTATAAAHTVLDGLRKMPDLADLAVRPPTRESIRFSIRRENAMRYGFSAADAAEISGAVNAILEHRTIARVNGPHGLPIDVAVTAAGDEPSSVGRFTVCTPEGDVIPLTSIADISIVEEPAAILHRNGRRVVFVTGRFAGGDRARTAREIEAYCRTIRLSEGLTVESMTND